MSIFLTGKELKEAIYDVIWKAEDELVIVSPFIKLNDYFKALFDKHKHNNRLRLLIIFGKNEAEPRKSLKKEDFDFFKQFNNVSIVYCPNLHAKYYGNDEEGVITSINLYDASFENNIEFGVHSKPKLLSALGLTSNSEVDAWVYVQELANEFPVVFVKRPIVEKGLLSSITGKKYLKGEVLYDVTKELAGFNSWGKLEKRFLKDFPDEIDPSNKPRERPKEEDFQVNKEKINNYKYVDYERMKSTTNIPSGFSNNSSGFCIRTGDEIPYNPYRPYSDSAYNVWSKYKDGRYQETYCHKCKGFAKTTMVQPLCRKCQPPKSM